MQKSIDASTAHFSPAANAPPHGSSRAVADTAITQTARAGVGTSYSESERLMNVVASNKRMKRV